jgi:solute:Na+ symporter, SSS family
MVASEHLPGLRAAICVYFGVLALSAVAANVHERRMHKRAEADHVTTHYLGGQSFNAVVTAGTIFASYTVVGIPNEAFKTGFVSLRWMATSVLLLAGYAGTGVRLRRLGEMRSHKSPSDFITDRFQSQILRYSVVLLQFFSALIYLSAQVDALKTIFNGAFNLNLSNPWPVVGIFYLILVFEWLGGLLSVAYTDCIQGFVMIVSFIAIAVVIKIHFGGWSDLDPFEYPIPQVFQTPTRVAQWKFWQFSVANISFFTLPHMVTRIYAAKSVSALRYGWLVMSFGPWFTVLVSVYLGTMGIAMLGGKTTGSPFNDIINAVMDLGGFPKFAGVIMWTASIAAIMSTADSLLIAISQLVTSEMVVPYSQRKSSVSVIGKLASLITVSAALTIGIKWKKGITDLTQIQFSLSLMLVPSFLFGLYSHNRQTDVHPWSLAVAALLSTLCVIMLYFNYTENNPTIPIDVGMVSLAINFALIFIFESGRRLFSGSKPSHRNQRQSTDEYSSNNNDDGEELLFPSRPQWDIPNLESYGRATLAPERIWHSMKGVYEPAATFWYPLCIFALVCFITPLTPQLEPPLDEDGQLLYRPATIHGLPWWAFKIIMVCLLATLMVMYTIFRGPISFNISDDKDMSDIEPLKDTEVPTATEYQDPSNEGIDTDKLASAANRDGVESATNGY